MKTGKVFFVIKYCLLNLLPIIVHMACIVFWLLGFGTFATMFESIVTVLLAPIYLVYINRHAISKISVRMFVMFLVTIIMILLAGIFFHYFNWGVTTGNFYNPDYETIALMHKEACISVFVAVLLACIAKFSKK